MDLMTSERADDIVTLTITGPTMPPPFFAECERRFGDLATDDRVRAIVVRSSAKGFSFGLDLAAAFATWQTQLTGGGLASHRTELRSLVLQLQRGFTAIATCPVPVIAAIHGRCIGGGVDFISACDLRIATADARFSVRETRVAIVADLGSLQRLPAIIGLAHTRELAYTGKDIDAARAAAIGLVNHVVPDRDAAWATANTLAQEIAANAPLVVRGVKHVLDRGVSAAVAEGLDHVATWNAAFLPSEDLGEAFAAFAQKRPAKFTGR
jgi:enoyl-CoA hydratase